MAFRLFDNSKIPADASDLGRKTYALQKIASKSFRRDMLERYPNLPPVFMDLRSRGILGYAFRKSFRRDILRGYLQNGAFVFIDLAGKRFFRVYIQYSAVNL